MILVWTPSSDNVAVTGYNVTATPRSSAPPQISYSRIQEGRRAQRTPTRSRPSTAFPDTAAATLNVTTTTSVTADADGDGLPDLTETALRNQRKRHHRHDKPNAAGHPPSLAAAVTQFKNTGKTFKAHHFMRNLLLAAMWIALITAIRADTTTPPRPDANAGNVDLNGRDRVELQRERLAFAQAKQLLNQDKCPSSTGTCGNQCIQS